MVSYSFVHSLSVFYDGFHYADNRGLFGRDVIAGYALERCELQAIRVSLRFVRCLYRVCGRGSYMAKANQATSITR